MKRRSRVWFWCYALHLRLFKKISFLIILCLIPILTLLVSLGTGDETAFVRVALAAEDPTDAKAAMLLEQMDRESQVAQFTRYTDAEEAREQALFGSQDTAWILLSDTEERIARIAKGEDIPLVRVYVREERAMLRLSREILFSSLFSETAYAIYADYVAALPLEQQPTAEQLHAAFHSYDTESDLITFVYTDGTTVSNDAHYLTSPLRGLLAAIVLLCGLAATLYFRIDEQYHRFSWLRTPYRFGVFALNNQAALSIAAVFATLALWLGGVYTDFVSETVSMLLFVLTANVCCLFVGSLCHTPGKLSMILPVLLVLSVVLCPVFFEIPGLTPIQMLLPSYAYLYAVDDLSWCGVMLLYLLIGGVLSFAIYQRNNRYG